MNLAEFPLAMLSTRGNPKVKTLEFRDVVKGKNGELLNRDWIITGADKFGLPTASDDEVLLGLLKLTVDEGMVDRKVYFTRYELLRILRWTTEGRSYTRLQRALDRLSGVRIKASNAFYDNESKLYNTRNFGIVDAYEINDAREPEAKSSFFIWSEVLFGSFQAGFIKKLDLDFYLDLKSAVSKRLYRYLDKHFWYKSKVQLNLFTLAHEKIGISRNYRFASSLRQQIDPAVEELTNLGFLARAEYSGRGDATEIALFAGKAAVLAPATNVSVVTEGMISGATSVEVVSTEIDRNRQTQAVHKLLQQKLERPDFGGIQPGREQGIELGQELSSRGIREDQVAKLLAAIPAKATPKIRQIIAHYDYLRASASPKISRSPQGFLFHAVKNWETFVLPVEKGRSENKQGALAFVSGSASSSRTAVSRRQESGEDLKDSEQRRSLERDYLVARSQEIRHIRETTIERELLAKLNRDVESALSRLRGNISPARFNEAVEHGVDEKIANLFAVPSFDEWLRDHPSKNSGKVAVRTLKTAGKNQN